MARAYQLLKERAREIFPLLVDAYHQKKGIFQYEGLFPELPIPKEIAWGGREHFNYWFFVTMADHSVRSMSHYREARKLYSKISQGEFPNIFQPEIAVALESERLKKALAAMCRGANNHPEEFKFNADRLLQQYGGNAQNVVDVSDIREAKERLQEFKRFGPGISGLYLLFLVKHNLVSYANEHLLEVKIDHHDVRGLHALGVLSLPEGEISDEEIIHPIASFLRDTCNELELRVIDLDSALWGLGVHGCGRRDEMWCQSVCVMYDLCNRRGMLGSYYKDGMLREGMFWARKGKSNIDQAILPIFQEKNLIQWSGVNHNGGRKR